MFDNHQEINDWARSVMKNNTNINIEEVEEERKRKRNLPLGESCDETRIGWGIARTERK